MKKMIPLKLELTKRPSLLKISSISSAPPDTTRIASQIVLLTWSITWIAQQLNLKQYKTKNEESIRAFHLKRNSSKPLLHLTVQLWMECKESCSSSGKLFRLLEGGDSRAEEQNKIRKGSGSVMDAAANTRVRDIFT